MAPPNGRAQMSPSNDDSDDDFMSPPASNRRPAARRLAGGGARGAPSPIISRPRGRLSSTRSDATRRSTGRGAAAMSRGGRQAPIFGGRQQQMVARAGRRGAVGSAGHAYRLGRPQQSPGTSTIVLSSSSDGDDDEDEDEEGDDVFDDDGDEEEEEEDEMGADDSLGGFIVFNGGTHGHNDDDDEDDDLDDDEEDEDDDEDDEEEGDRPRRRMPANPHEETFSAEMAQFDRMQEREQQAVARSEQRRLRLLEKEMNKENTGKKNSPPTDMFGACSVCMADEVIEPVGCVYCSNFIGCRRCATKWYIESKRNNDNKFANCPLCRAEWGGEVPEVADMLDLVLKNG